MKVENQAFNTRRARAEYIAHRFAPLLQESILDVGCDEAHLKALLPKEIEYFGVDVGGTPDMVLDLEKVARIPFEDGQFSTIICTDVLEHLDSLHRTFDELIRVCGKHAIISLPNCWVNARVPIQRGRGHFSHYGLPTTKPADRHKWFFSLSEIEAFFKAQAERHGLKIVDMHATEKPKNGLVRAVRKLRYPNAMSYLNRYANTLWVVFEK